MKYHINMVFKSTDGSKVCAGESEEEVEEAFKLVDDFFKSISFTGGKYKDFKLDSNSLEVVTIDDDAFEFSFYIDGKFPEELEKTESASITDFSENMRYNNKFSLEEFEWNEY